MQTHAYHRRCARAVLVGITIALRRPHGRMKIVGCPGSLSGKTLRRCEVRPHLNPLPGGEEVASPPPLWIPAPYRGSGCVFAGKTKWGRRLAQVVVSRLAFFRGILVRGFPPPYRGTGHAFDRGNDEWGVAGMTIREIRGIPRHYQSRVASFSYQSLMPAGAGTPRYEKLELWLGTANWHRGFCHAPPPPQRGTSPSPRVVFDRTTFPIPTPSGFRPSPE